ncbi:MAG: ImuA family protein [Janthinobacterium lividum]
MNVLSGHAEVVEALRVQIEAAERQGRAPSRGAALPFGVTAVDQHLPEGGLLFGAVHELQAAGPDVEICAAPAVFAAGALACRLGPVVWIGRRGGVLSYGLLQAGLDPHRVVFVDAGGEVLLAMEEAPRHPDVAGVVCELEGRLDLVASRRLQLASGGTQALGFLLRRSRRFDDPALRQPSAATTRWRIGVVPSPSALAHALDVGGCTGRSGGWTWCTAAAAYPRPGPWGAATCRVVSL